MKVHIDKKDLYFVNVPDKFKNFKIVHYSYSGSWLMEIDSLELNAWKIHLPKGFKYEIIGFVSDNIILFPDDIKGDENFILRKVKI